MGRTIEDANSSLRISIGKFTTAHEITLVADAFERALKN
jgi:cysteine sulfinate desulfinase/cysteine desulfurase-like protein